ncbi:hypothetical protein QAD02_018317 [Eretmocerus hayati]|uniref:Uncharacterized protein n=1 Tax=Eretmocerus hayati TaxID=131215 RepID=A0ACC2PG16_9HYME|nr:hypothetical protein QAD02_018317 [Eretmocerus hayati]
MIFDHHKRFSSFTIRGGLETMPSNSFRISSAVSIRADTPSSSPSISFVRQNSVEKKRVTNIATQLHCMTDLELTMLKQDYKLSVKTISNIELAIILHFLGSSLETQEFATLTLNIP